MNSAAWTSPPVLADDLGITRQGVRAWLKRHGYPKDDDGFYRIDAATEARMRAHFAARKTPPPLGPCSVDECDRPRRSRGAELCALHHQRMSRHGTLERSLPGQNQRAKTHCPKGHPYTPENTYRFADGRRRCRRCRLDRAAAAKRTRATPA
ncbi:hypothetical protein AAG589_20975 [Isoptericola sp. F-RaC21]|uniref:hypothetical protein n=1 Tax=Isoptericola sp. F-RaC21 TaxID=3141452 RepID=UPI00315C121C